MADPQELHAVEEAVPPAREPFPEETEDVGRREKARSYFQQHPAARWMLLLLVIAIAAGGYFIWSYYSVRETTDDAQVDAHIAPITPRVSGTVIAIHVDDNQFVEHGAVLVQLDPRDYQVALQRAEAELADAEANAQAAHTGVPMLTTTTSSTLLTSHANVVAVQREVDAAQARVREAQANYTRTQQDLKRYQELVKKDEISQQQYDAAVANNAAAQAALQAAQAAVATAQSHVVQAQEQVRSAQTAPQQVAISQARAGAATALVQQKQAAVAQARLNLEYTTLKAPVSGIVSKRSAELGQVVQAGQPLMSVVNLEDIWVTANFKETQLQFMRVGQRATIHVDAYDRELRGHVDSIGGGTGARFSLLPPENATGNYVKVVQRTPVKIVLDDTADPRYVLGPGMSVE
ncbi:MAG TPA: HlyD family secretion protein, partial [Ramlibacter sp.]|nr:HlyD family secretion protein [Ramlibacter sp.]